MKAYALPSDLALYFAKIQETKPRFLNLKFSSLFLSLYTKHVQKYMYMF